MRGLAFLRLRAHVRFLERFSNSSRPDHLQTTRSNPNAHAQPLAAATFPCVRPITAFPTNMPCYPLPHPRQPPVMSRFLQVTQWVSALCNEHG